MDQFDQITKTLSETHLFYDILKQLLSIILEPPH